jgi:hypothetical protein
MEQAAQGFVAALQAGESAKAEATMDPAFRAATPPSRLRALLAGPDRPLLHAGPLQCDSVQPMAHGTRAVLHAHFLSAGTPYRTNILLTRNGPGWLVSGLIPPVGRQTLTRHQGQLSKRH